MNEMGKKIKELRIKKKLTQLQLAEKLGLAESTISLYESGVRKPSVKVIKKLSDTLSINPDYFFTDNTNGVSEEKKEKIKLIARNMEQLSEDQLEAIMTVISSFSSPKK